MSLANAACNISADIPSDGHYEVTIVKTSIDTASINIQEWDLGASLLQTPQHDNTYQVNTVRVNGNIFSCQASAMLQTPVITIILSGKQVTIPSATISITHTWWSNFTKTLPLTDSEYAEIEKFLVDAAFPLG